MKKLFKILICLLFCFGFVSSVSAESLVVNNSLNITNIQNEELIKENLANLSYEQIQEKFTEIHDKYEIDEVFNLEDQLFVEMYAIPENSNNPNIRNARGSWKTCSVSSIKTISGITAAVSGTLRVDINNIINQRFGSDLSLYTTGAVNKINSVKLAVYHDAYGLIGSQGVGKVYSSSISTSGRYLNSTKSYTDIVAYSNTWAVATINYTGGSFTVN